MLYGGCASLLLINLREVESKICSYFGMNWKKKRISTTLSLAIDVKMHSCAIQIDHLSSQLTFFFFLLSTRNRC